MIIQERVDLTDYNGLRVPALARWFARPASIEELEEAADFARERDLSLLVLGEGSNLVLTADVDGLVVIADLKGRRVDESRVTAQAGENWHQLVSWTTGQGLYGLENLALIPGTVGAAPVQNIGAYGIELSDRLISVRAFNYMTREHVVLDRNDCQPGYRDSVFKHERHWIITSVNLALTRDDEPVLDYPGVSDWLAAEGLEPHCETVFDAIVSLRTQKLPDPRVIPNVGSFFKNPVLDAMQVEALERPGMPVYEAGNGFLKLSAAWLIDQAGLKGSRVGGICVSDQHALVLINLGSGTGSDLLRLVERIRARVQDEFGIALEIEPSVYPV